MGNIPVRSVAAMPWIALAFCSVLILLAARGDLWLDEIWSLGFARDAQSAADVFSRFRHDNNHPLNTLYLYLMGQHAPLLAYRLLAVASGIGSVALAGYLAAKSWGYPEALCSVVLTGTSYPLVLYFSEARGYAPATFFALAAYAALLHVVPRWWPAGLALFWMASILGFLSHATFIMPALAFLAWTLTDQTSSLFAQEERGSRRAESQSNGAEPALRAQPNGASSVLLVRAARRATALHSPPLLFFAWWYLYFLRHMEIGGGPVYSMWAVLDQAAAMLLGLPEEAGPTGTALVVALALVVLGTLALLRQRDPQWTLSPAALIVAPALLLIVTRPTFLYFRYFIVCFPFFYLLISRLACTCWRSLQANHRWLVPLAIAAMLAGHAYRDWRLLIFGRGSYSAALADIAAATGDGTARVGSDHDFRNRMLFDFYAARSGSSDKLRYVDLAEWTEAPPSWILTHSQNPFVQPLQTFPVPGIGKYVLVMEYPFSGVSGWSWFLYQRLPA